MVSSDPAAAAQEFARLAADLELKAQQYEQLRGRMTALAITEESRDGRVRVTVDANGVPTDITLTDRARGVDPAALSAQIMSCLTTAQARLRDQVTGLVHSSVGDDSAGEMVIGQYTQRFPAPEAPADTPQPPAWAPPAPPPPAPAEPAPADSGPARGKWRDEVVTPDEPDEDDLYFRRKNWLE
jgi:hypothetical protein